MKAALLKEYGTFEIIEKDLPDPGPDEVRVRIGHASICGTDMHIFTGDFHPRTPVPFIPGHEMAGRVEQAGSNVKDYSPGDKVAVDPIIWCGQCPACQAHHYPACSSLKLLGVDMDGGFAEMINVPASMLFRASPEVQDRHLALTELYGIGFHANGRAGVKAGETIAIWGAGRVGQVILQAARTITDQPVFMVDVLDERLEIATGAYPDVIALNALREQDVPAMIREHTGGNGVDVSFEAVGHAHFPEETINPVRGAIQSIRGAGRVCVLGLGDDPAPVVFKELIWKEATIIASRVSHGEYPVIIENLEQGKLRPEALISEVLPPEQIQDAFALLEEQPDRYLKILINFS